MKVSKWQTRARFRDSGCSNLMSNVSGFGTSVLALRIWGWKFLVSFIRESSLTASPTFSLKISQMSSPRMFSISNVLLLIRRARCKTICLMRCTEPSVFRYKKASNFLLILLLLLHAACSHSKVFPSVAPLKPFPMAQGECQVRY